MKNARPFAAAAATLLLISACNENDRPPLPEDGERIRVEVGIVSTLHSALQASTNHYSTLKKCRYRYWILPKFVTFL